MASRGMTRVVEFPKAYERAGRRHSCDGRGDSLGESLTRCITELLQNGSGRAAGACWSLHMRDEVEGARGTPLPGPEGRTAQCEPSRNFSCSALHQQDAYPRKEPTRVCRLWGWCLSGTTNPPCLGEAAG